MKRTLLVIAILFSTITTALAEETRDIVSLKNGSVIKGSVIEQTPNESVKIKTADGSIFVYSWDEVSKITKEPVESNQGGKSADAASATQKSSRTTSTKTDDDKAKVKYRGEFQVGWGLSLQGVESDRLMISTVQGVDINKHFAVGIGAGINAIMPNDMSDNKTGLYIPIYVNGKAYTHLTKSISLLASVDIGGAFGVSKNLEDFGGLLISSGAGIQFKNFSLLVSYEVQRDNDEASDYVHRYDAITFKAGYQF